MRYGMILLAFGVFLFCSAPSTYSQTSGSLFRIGEKLTYNISFGKFRNTGYAELYVASRGRLGAKDAVEIRAKAKTFDLVSAAFLMLDENRTVYAAPDTGLPLYIRRSTSEGLPGEAINNYLTEASSSYDLVTLIYKLRESGGVGTFPFFEKNKLYTATFTSVGSERVSTDAGEFDTTVSTAQSDFLNKYGIKELRINFTSDEFRTPVLISYKSLKGDMRVALTGIYFDQLVAAAPIPTPVPTPAVVATPKPRPSPSPEPYVDNKPLSPELGFDIGESLSYAIKAEGKPVATITLAVGDRKLFKKKDSLLLSATITGTEPGNQLFALGDSVKVQVDPETLDPQWLENKFGGALTSYNQTVSFDPRSGEITVGTATPIEAPIGTHTILSLIYAMRSFNLQKSQDLNNPVNDTRVAVFWESKPYVFTLRPSKPEDITLNGQKVSAQLVTVNTGNPKLDELAPKVWLSAAGRVPLRFSVGKYVADLIPATAR